MEKKMAINNKVDGKEDRKHFVGYKWLIAEYLEKVVVCLVVSSTRFRGVEGAL